MYRTLLKQGPYGRTPIVKKALIVTPGSLVKVRHGINTFTRVSSTRRGYLTEVPWLVNNYFLFAELGERVSEVVG